MTLRSSRVLSVLLVLAALPLARAGDAPGADSLSGPSYVVKASRIYTGHPDKLEGCIAGGLMLVREGRVVAVGNDIAIPPGLDLLDLEDAVVIPGLVLADGLLVGEAGGEETAGAQYAALDAWDFYARRTDLLQGGITTAYLSPGRNRLVAGRGAVVKTAGASVSGRTLQAWGDLAVNADEEAFMPPALVEYPLPPSSDNPFEPALPQPPTTRLGVFYELNRALDRAAAYEAARAGAMRPKVDASLEAMASALREAAPWRIRARRADDIHRAAVFARAEKRKVVITGATESASVAEFLGHEGLGVVLEVPLRWGGLPDEIGNRPDPLTYDPATAARLTKAGVLFALSADPSESPARLLEAASSTVQGGLTPLQALQKITSHAAAILGVDARVGALAKGRDADFVVLTDDPFTLGAQVSQVFIGGVRYFDGRRERGVSGLVVKAETVITGTGQVLTPGAVLVEDGKIVAVGDRVAAPAGARVIDGGKGSYLVPGFVDAHSHLGFVDDRSAADSDTVTADVLGADQVETRRVARAGVTTALLAPYRAGERGGRVAALKTAGAGRAGMVVETMAGLKFSALNLDPVEGVTSFRKTLEAAKQYDEKWKKYEEELAKWEAAQRGEQAKPEEKKPEEKAKAEEAEKKTEKRSDPITGKWSFTISGGPLPEPQEGSLFLKLEGTTITGKATSPLGDEEVEVKGSLNGNEVVLEIQAETPFGPPRIEATIDRPDHMTGKLKIGDYVTLDVEATRVEKKEFDVVVVSKKRKAKEETGKPEPPPLDEKQEPFRRLFARKAPAFIEAEEKLIIEALLALFVDEFKIPVVLLNAPDAHRMTERLRQAGVGVVIEPRVLRRLPDGEWLHAAGALSRAGVPIAFQSDGGDSARGLRELAAYSVRQGLDPTEALRALTVHPSRLFGIDDRVGSIAPGRDGDLVLLNGHPLELGTSVERVFVRGKEVGPE
ncbi:MAG: amidohydrolase family protein [Planctomycetota bacterium]